MLFEVRLKRRVLRKSGSRRRRWLEALQRLESSSSNFRYRSNLDSFLPPHFFGLSKGMATNENRYDPVARDRN
ncbi:hypothetical protein V1478_003898 [Vespula squamosa]|uniref:Uncharacterized protein n=1 Tax=Vespula squamosa TaxID=30214 RepID=A0ABD2BNP9_VESSQ